VQQIARRPEPEGRRNEEPDGNDGGPADVPQAPREDDEEAEQTAENEEPDREPRLVGQRPHLDAPSPA